MIMVNNCYLMSHLISYEHIFVCEALVFKTNSPWTSVCSAVVGLELCDPPHRLMVATVAALFGVLAEAILPPVALLCQNWQFLQAAVTLPLVLLLPYWW